MSQTIKTSALRHEIILELGGACERCGWAGEPRVLKIVRRDGKNVPRGGGSQWLQHLLYVRQRSEEFLLICPNCFEVAKLRPKTVVWNIEGLPWETATMQAIERLKTQYPQASVRVVHHQRVFDDSLNDWWAAQEFMAHFGVTEFPLGVTVYE